MVVVGIEASVYWKIHEHMQTIVQSYHDGPILGGKYL